MRREQWQWLLGELGGEARAVWCPLCFLTLSSSVLCCNKSRGIRWSFLTQQWIYFCFHDGGLLPIETFQRWGDIHFWFRLHRNSDVRHLWKMSRHLWSKPNKAQTVFLWMRSTASGSHNRAVLCLNSANSERPGASGEQQALPWTGNSHPPMDRRTLTTYRRRGAKGQLATTLPSKRSSITKLKSLTWRRSTQEHVVFSRLRILKRFEG